MALQPVTIDDLRMGVRLLGLQGRPVCAHTSLRSFGRVEGGATAVVDAFLAEGCTLLVPTHSYDFEIAPPADMRPARNGYDYEQAVSGEDDTVGIFRDQENELSIEDMGALPAAVLAREDRVRGRHPLASFAAVGERAREIIAGQGPEDVYAPFRALAGARGAVLLMGVGLTRMTLIHWAEQKAGRALFRRWAKADDGRPVMVEVGGCSDGFDKLTPTLAPIARTTRVGASAWTALDAADAVDTLATAIMREPELTSCDDATCLRCRDSVAGGPILTQMAERPTSARAALPQGRP